MSDTDGLAAETRRLLDAATEGDWDQVGATVEKEVDVGWCIVVAECDKVADAALIAAAPRLLANWLAREDRDWFPSLVSIAAERDRLADENRALRAERGLRAAAEQELRAEVRALREQLDAAQLRSIEARNPGIDMEEVRRMRLAYPDHERHETVSRAKYGASLASDIAADGGAAVAEGAEDRGQTDG